MDVPQTRYAPSGDAWIAYQTIGDGPFDLLVIGGVGRHIELAWENPHWATWNRRLASLCRVLLFDKRGTGMSDPLTGRGDARGRMEDLRAVLDAAGSERTLLFAVGDG